MDKHTLAGLAVAIAALLIAALFYESDIRARWERARRRRRRRQRQKGREKN